MTLRSIESRDSFDEHPQNKSGFSFQALRRGLAPGLLTAILIFSSAVFAQPVSETKVTALVSPGVIEEIEAGQPVKVTPEEVGDALMFHKRYQAAIGEYKKAPDSSYAWNKMGMAHQLMFNLKDAVRSYQKALKINPHNCYALNNLATAYDSLKEGGKAEHLYREAAKLDPKNALIRKNLGTNLIAQHKYQQGWETYQDALALDSKIFERHVSSVVPNNVAVGERGAMNYYMARGCARAGRHECALDFLRKSVLQGFVNAKKIADDREFAVLLSLPEFQELLAAGREH